MKNDEQEVPTGVRNDATPPDTSESPSVWETLGAEAAFALETFSRTFATVLVLRIAAELVTRSPNTVRTIWDRAPAFGSKPRPNPSHASPHFQFRSPADDEVDVDDDPELVMTVDGERLYRHRLRHSGQLWPCPVLRTAPCRGCEWFVHDPDGEPRCAVRAKLALREHPRLYFLDLQETRELLTEGSRDLDGWLD